MRRATLVGESQPMIERSQPSPSPSSTRPGLTLEPDVHSEFVPQRILLADDQPAMRRFMARILRNLGHEVVLAVDGADALEKFANEPFQMVVSDINMPEIDGLELLAVIRRISPETPVLLLTGRPSVETAVAAIRKGATSYLPKPFEAIDLKREVSRALAESEPNAGQPLASRDSQKVLAELQLNQQLDEAIASLYMVYQPIVSISRNVPVGHEALMRCHSTSLPHPGAILDAAEKLGRIQEVGQRVRLLCARTMRTLPEDVVLYVNLHTDELSDEELYDLDSPLSHFANRIVLEVTERVRLDQMPELPERLERLRKMGYRLAVDDIGAGYAGLTSFALLEPEVVKIDMALIRNINEAPLRQRLVKALTTLCRELGVDIIAEGVETIAERDTVHSLGTDQVQGYLFAKPSPSIELAVGDKVVTGDKVITGDKIAVDNTL